MGEYHLFIIPSLAVPSMTCSSYLDVTVIPDDIGTSIKEGVKDSN